MERWMADVGLTIVPTASRATKGAGMTKETEQTATKTAQTAQPKEGVALSETIHAPSPRERASLSWSFGGLQAGDCILSDGTFTAYSDGTTEWHADFVVSATGGDSWLATFELFDANGTSLWTFPRIWSPSLDPAGAVIRWSNDQLTYPAYMFPYLSRMTMHYHC